MKRLIHTPWSQCYIKEKANNWINLASYHGYGLVDVSERVGAVHQKFRVPNNLRLLLTRDVIDMEWIDSP